MIDLVKGFFGNIFGKIAMGLLIAAAVLAYIFYLRAESTQKDLNEKSAEVTRLQGSVKDLQKTLDDKNKADKVTEKVEGEVREKIVYVERKGADIQKEVDRKVAEILAKSKESGQPLNPEGEKLVATQVSTVRVDGLWKTYCEAVPDNSSCAFFNAPPAPAASGVTTGKNK